MNTTLRDSNLLPRTEQEKSSSGAKGKIYGGKARIFFVLLGFLFGPFGVQKVQKRIKLMLCMTNMDQTRANAAWIRGYIR